MPFGIVPVSYTHLDVYKRQTYESVSGAAKQYKAQGIGSMVVAEEN